MKHGGLLVLIIFAVSGCLTANIERVPLVRRATPTLIDTRVGQSRAGAATRILPFIYKLPLSGWGAFLWQHDRLAIANDIPERQLKTRVLILEDATGSRVALIATDLHGGSRYITEYVARALQSEGFHAGNVFLTATHNHSGPGGLYASPYFDGLMASTSLSRTGNPDTRIAFNKDLADAIGTAIVDTAREAIEKLRPAKVGFSRTYFGNTINRSPSAIFNNFDDENDAYRQLAAAFPSTEKHNARSKERRAVDSDIYTIAAFRSDNSELIGAFTTVNAHCALIHRNALVQSADFFGHAASLIESDPKYDGGVMALSAGAQGDADPGDPLDPAGPEMAFDKLDSRRADEANELFENPSSPSLLTAEYGVKLETALGVAIQTAKGVARPLKKLRAVFTDVEIAGQSISNGVRLSATADIGKAAVAGSEFGRGPRGTCYQEGVLREGDSSDPQQPKDTSRVLPWYAFPLQGANELLASQDAHFPIRIVELLYEDNSGIRLLGLPGEPTTWLGHLLRKQMDIASGGRHFDTAIAGVTGDYQGYLTTSREYDMQQYEGGSTIWGRETQPFIELQVQQLLRGLDDLNYSPPPPPANDVYFNVEFETWTNHLDKPNPCFEKLESRDCADFFEKQVRLREYEIRKAKGNPARVTRLQQLKSSYEMLLKEYAQ